MKKPFKPGERVVHVGISTPIMVVILLLHERICCSWFNTEKETFESGNFFTYELRRTFLSWLKSKFSK